jgi:hypothetical protein
MIVQPVGKGMYIWQVSGCEGGNLDAIVATAQACGFRHILVKIADGTGAYNVSVSLPTLVSKLHQEAGIQVWGWQYIYGASPIAEAKTAIEQCKQCGVDGFIVDAEGEFKQSGYGTRADAYMHYLRDNLSIPVGLSSYRFPSYHPDFPWASFRKYADFDAPQVYWQSAHNPAEQLRRSMGEFAGMIPKLPYVPTGAAYKTGILWSSTPADVRAFMGEAVALGLSGFNFWEWKNARALPDVWQAICEYNFPAPPAPPAPPTPDEIAMIKASLDQLRADLARSQTAIGALAEKISILGVTPMFMAKPVSQALARHPIGYNDKGKPIMAIYPSDNAPVDQRIFIAGKVALFPTPITADGGGQFYAIVDSDIYNRVAKTLYVRVEDVAPA